MRKNDVSNIKALTDLQLTANRLKLRSLRERELSMSVIIAQFDEHSRLLGANTLANASDNIEFRNEIAMCRWLDQQRKTVNIELAQTKALIEIEVDRLSRHFSRKIALQGILDREKNVAELRDIRRVYYGP